MEPIERLTESLEDYLEAIFEISKSGPARVRDIANKLDVRMASVSGAIKKLRKKGLVTPGHYDYINLTDLGQRVAAIVTEKHNDLKNFLNETLRIENIVAEADACRIEHALSKETIQRMKSLHEFIHHDQSRKNDWLNWLSRSN